MREKRNSTIEIFVLVFTVINSMFIAGLTYYVGFSDLYQKESIVFQQDSLTNNKRILEKRWELYSELSLKMNTIYNYVYYSGRWRNTEPTLILEYQKSCDEIIQSFEPAFTKEFVNNYDTLKRLSFYTEKNDFGEIVRIYSDWLPHWDYYTGDVPWKEDWNLLFYNYDPNNTSVNLNQRILQWENRRRNSQSLSELKDRERRELLQEFYYRFIYSLKKELQLQTVIVKREFEDLKPKIRLFNR